MIADSGNRGLIIWPIAQRIFNNPLMLQQRPRWTGGRPVPKLPALPWAECDRPPTINFGKVDRAPIAMSYLPSNFGLCAVNAVSVRASMRSNEYYSNPNVHRMPTVIHEIKPQPATLNKISGISKDATGNVLDNCKVSLFRVDRDSGNNKIYTFISTTISDSNGNYFFNTNDISAYMVTVLNADGSLGGLSSDTLTGVNV